MTLDPITGVNACRVVAVLLSASLTYGQTDSLGIGAASPALSSVIGFYHWGGQPRDSFAKGLAQFPELNARIARITLSRRMDRDYRKDAGCIQNYSLPAILERPEVRSAVSGPNLDVLMITAYDGAALIDCAHNPHLSPTYYTVDKTQDMIREYSDFAYGLRKLAQGNSKRIILSDWEGDNLVYCGSAHLYIQSLDFRKLCQDHYGENYGGNRGPSDTLEGMILWHRARYAGVTAGNSRADAEGFRSPSIALAPEISAVHMLSTQGFKSVLHDVIRHVPFDYISYSSYESLGQADAAEALRKDLDTIRDISGSAKIIVGEMGYSRSNDVDGAIERTRKVLDAALRWGVVYIIQWNLYDQDSPNLYGMFDEVGSLTAIGRFYQGLLSGMAGCEEGGKEVWRDEACDMLTSR